MKKVFIVLLVCIITQFAFAGDYPVLKVELKGGLAGRVDAVVNNMKDHNGPASICFNLFAESLANINYQEMQMNPSTQLDVTDYQVSTQLLSYAKNEIANNHLNGEVKKEIADAKTGAKRVYKLKWSSRNKFGDKGSIDISKLDQQQVSLVGLVA